MRCSERVSDLGPPVYGLFKGIFSRLVVAQSLSGLFLCVHHKWTWRTDTSQKVICYRRCWLNSVFDFLNTLQINFAQWGEKTQTTYRVSPKALWLVFQRSAENGKLQSPVEQIRCTAIIFPQTFICNFCKMHDLTRPGINYGTASFSWFRSTTIESWSKDGWCFSFCLAFAIEVLLISSPSLN